MRTNKSTKVSENLQEELAAFGILRSKVMEKAAPREDGEAEFFGIKNYGGNTVELKFDTSIDEIQNANMTVALAAPELSTFNMLVTTNFDEAVKVSTKEDLRSYLRRIVDKA